MCIYVFICCFVFPSSDVRITRGAFGGSLFYLQQNGCVLNDGRPSLTDGKKTSSTLRVSSKY